ncbi:hypothetical protein MTP09_04715 [Chryseobacterium suipulveris]|uniref:Uncharacterized protein n=1 Tax=Chryseobacterium suipulveris TaxID=2929800 RepID=A0ABY4BT40_9FLAO|nr:hypothetical protein [Chryseobacterium suipulveris]UOE41939.1 hypothetical protein MTP09_04715 [Chryseobacterium suipulveris]
MDNSRKLHKFAYDDYTVVTNFETFEDAKNYAAERNGEMLEVGFTDGSDNPMPNSDGNLIADKRTFRVGLDPEYQVLYSDDPKFQEMSELILEEMKKKENDVAPEDWLGDQNIAPGDRIIIVKNDQVNTVTTRERIKFLMRGNVYELAVKIPGTETE